MALTKQQRIGIGVGVGIAVLLGIVGLAGAEEPEPFPFPPEPEPDPDVDDEDNAQDVFDSIYSNTPVPGKFYLIKQGDTLSGIVRKALNAAVPASGKKGGTRVKYMKCISASPWNRELYGNPDDFTSKFPKYTSPDNVSLRSAFFANHADARASILTKTMPTRGSGSSYGMLWLPLVNKGTLQTEDDPACMTMQWEAGTSGLEPPQILFNLWENA